MNRQFALILAAAACLPLFTALLVVVRLQRAQDERAAAAESRDDIIRMARQLSPSALGGAADGDADLLPLVRQSLAAASIPAASLAALRNRGTGAARRVELRLSGLTPLDLARWYVAFSREPKAWRAEELTMTGSRSAPAGGPPAIDALLILSPSR